MKILQAIAIILYNSTVMLGHTIIGIVYFVFYFSTYRFRFIFRGILDVYKSIEYFINHRNEYKSNLNKRINLTKNRLRPFIDQLHKFLEIVIVFINNNLKVITKFIKNNLSITKDFLLQIKKIFVSSLTKYKNTFKKIITKSKQNVNKKNKNIKKSKKYKSKNKSNVKTFRISEKNKSKIKGLRYFILGILFSLIFILIPLEMYIWFNKLPKAELLKVQGSNKSTKILDKNDNLLYEIYVDKKYSPVKLTQIPQNVINATLAVEDTEFYNHNGLRPQRILKALEMTLIQGQKQGASTITQQLVKNVLLTNERTISRKIKEAVITIFVEGKYTKDEILEMYLNNISYGGVAWGIQSASQKYFGLDVWELNLAQSSMLAGLPSSPSIYSPLVNYELAKNRQLHVLNRMYDSNFITKEQLEDAYNEELVFIEQSDFIRAPHFVHYIRDLAEQEYGKRQVDYGGLTIKTSLDLDLQSQVETIVKEQIKNSEYLNLTNAAAIVLDVDNSEILAYVGSVDYFESQWGAYDILQSYRQPGSSIKPVTYALALDNGYTANSILYDTKISIPQAGQKPYVPVNYDLRYRGAVTLRNSLANSYNIPPVKLTIELGAENVVELGKKMGLESWNKNDNYGVSVTLGSKEVKLIEHANLYATFARQGDYKKLNGITSVIDQNGNEIYKRNEYTKNVLSKEVSYLIYDILSDNNARSTTFGYNSDLKIDNYKVAVKTGTTDEKRDNWTMGYTPNYVVGVWVGNNDNTPMNNYLASGLTGASPIWNNIFTEVLQQKSDNKMQIPDGIFEFYDERCNRKEYFIKGTKIPSTLCPIKKTQEDKDKKDKKEDND